MFLFITPVKEDLSAGSGGCPDEKDVTINGLQTQILNLEAENTTLLEKVDELTSQLQQLKVSPSDPGNDGDLAGGLSDDAVRKGLMRICSRKQGGTLGIFFWGLCSPNPI